jgi:DNA repair exonuclease SbcCD nuclease subunit
MLEHKITEIFQLGDLFDNRTQLNLKAFHQCKSSWLDPLVEYGFKMHVLLGNHDITLRESLDINTPESTLQFYIQQGVVQVYKTPTVVNVGDTTLDIIPWICSGNVDAVTEFINRKQVSDLCLGHFEISGASMYRGIPGHGGLKQEMFERYERVLSGHYHTRSTLMDGKIQYVGTPYELTWMDAHDPRGFSVFDTETRTLEFVPNPEVMFRKIYYKGAGTPHATDVSGKFIKLIVERKDDLYQFDTYINNLRLQDPYDLAIVENTDDLIGGSAGDDDLEVEDTITIIGNYIDSLSTSIDKEKVKAYINGLYIEAIKR